MHTESWKKEEGVVIPCHERLCLSQTRTWISNVICRGLFMWWEMIVRLVDIDGINDHQLFKLSFHVMIINVYTLILRICTDLHTCLQGSESIVLAGKDTMMHVHVLRIGSLYRGLCTYAHTHRYLGECVVWLWLVEMYKSRHVIRRPFH